MSCMSSNFSKKFGQAVREAREKMHISQEELGYKVDLHKNYIGMIERAERNISLEKALKLILTLNIEIKDLYEQEKKLSSK